MSNNTQESWFHNTLSMHIGELINLNEKDKELKKKKNNDFYKLAKNTPNVNKNILEIIKLQSELNYVFPKKMNL